MKSGFLILIRRICAARDVGQRTRLTARWATAASVGLLAVLAAMATGGRVDGTTRVPLGTFLALAAVPGWWLATVLASAGG